MKRGRPWPILQRARRAIGLGCALGAMGCDAPHYVSLGWNDSAVRAEIATNDGGTEAVLGGEATADDFARANARDRSQPCSFGPARIALRAACEPRPLAACPELGETPGRTLDAVLSSVLRECGEYDDLLSVSFEGGCAIAFELALDAAALAAAPVAPVASAADDTAPPDASVPAATSSRAAEPDAGALDTGALDTAALDTAVPERASVRRCIGERLAAQRFECARDIACGDGVNSAPLTR
jgi:hypothetical protein